MSAKFKKGDRVKANARGVAASPKDIELGMSGTVTEITNFYEYVVVDFDNGLKAAYMIEKELEFMSKFKVGDRVEVTEGVNVRADGAASVRENDIGTIEKLNSDDFEVAFDHLKLSLFPTRNIHPKYLKLVESPVDTDDRSTAVFRLMSAGLASENPEFRSGFLAMAAVIGGETSKSADKVIAALLGKS